MNDKNEDQIFEELLKYLKQERGFNFTAYKRSNLKRRISKQMELRQINNFSDYLDYLQVHAEEFTALFNTILINVTSFFRDKSTWDFLQKQILTNIINERSASNPIRIWTAGCSTGEEAYTLVMILTELLGNEKVRNQVKLYATDVDEDALNVARRAFYSSQSLESLPEGFQEKYFEKTEGGYLFRSDLRRVVIFGRHDLVSDAPISHLDLLTCRNTLMYFNAETQEGILNRFHFSLNKTGLLLLGRAEMIVNRTNQFTAINVEHHLFSKIEHNYSYACFLNSTNRTTEKNNQYLINISRLLKFTFDEISIAQIIVDRKGNLVLLNRAAQSMFALTHQDIGRPLKDLEISYRPLELRSRIEQVSSSYQPIKVNNVIHTLPNGNVQNLDVQITPLLDKELLGICISITDISGYYHLQNEFKRANRELEIVTENMQSTNEELETTNEELQSANEELETTNEELQSTNEELETINEELQSTNDELQAINNQLRESTKDLNHVNSFLNAILASLNAGVAVVDSQFNILSWNTKSEDLWGLRQDEIKGKNLFSLDIGLPIEQLRGPILDCIADKTQSQRIILDAINRKGQSIQCEIIFNQLVDPNQVCQGVIIIIKESADEPRSIQF